MNKIYVSRKNVTRVVIALSATVLALGLLAILYSLIKPYDKFGYNTLFIDSKSKTYRNGQEFEYGPYVFKITMKKTDVPPPIRPCDGRWLSIEECTSLNEKDRKKAAGLTYVDVTYEVTAKRESVDTLNGDWLQLYDSQGQRILIAPSGIQAIPSAKITKTMRAKEEKRKSETSTLSTVLSLPMRSKQTIVLTTE